jgi:phenylpropionate dioxygenase-like ring-hydroxylating dioxygenase large terminal subunit
LHIAMSIEATLWHPVAACDALGDGPLAVRLLAHDLVLWRDAPDRVRAFADRCPHRGAKLSLGGVRDGVLECAYHGWRFEGSAQCVAVPALPGFRPPPGHRACAYEAREAHGFVWARLAGGEEGLPALDSDASLRTLVVGPYDVATSAPRVVENFLDLSHFGFVHEGLLGDRAHTAVPEYRVQATPQGLVATDCRAWQPQSHRLAREGSEVAYRYDVVGPYLALLTKQSEGEPGHCDVIALLVCPMDAERSRVWFRMGVTDRASSDEELRGFQHLIFTQDQPILESQSPRSLPLTGGELHSAADRLSSAYRRYLRLLGISFGVC